MITDVLMDPFRYVLGVAFVGGAGFVAGLVAMWWYVTTSRVEGDS